MSAQLNVIEFLAGKLVFNLSCVDHKDEKSIERYIIDICIVRVGEWRSSAIGILNRGCYITESPT